MIRDTLLQVINEDMHDIWSILNAEERRIVVDNFTIHEFRRNQIIYSQNDTADNLYCLLRGKVKIFKAGVGGRTQIIRLYRPVQYFGFRAYFAEEPHMSSASAFEPSTLGMLPNRVVADLIDRNRALAWYFIRTLACNLGGSDARIVNLTQKHIRGRLAEALIVLRDNYGYEDDDATIRIYMSREDLANLSNMTTSNAIRTLTAFATERLIAVDGRRIKIINEAALRKISKNG